MRNPIPFKEKTIGSRPLFHIDNPLARDPCSLPYLLNQKKGHPPGGSGGCPKFRLGYDLASTVG